MGASGPSGPLVFFFGAERTMVLGLGIWDVGPTRFAQMMNLD